MKLAVFLLFSMMLSGISVNTYADNFGPLAHCYKPTKPLWLATAYYKERYNQDVEDYQHCMKAFIRAQEAAVKIHTQAAQQALQTWNDFVQEK